VGNGTDLGPGLHLVNVGLGVGPGSTCEWWLGVALNWSNMALAWALCTTGE
jgi:hypothetical protein